MPVIRRFTELAGRTRAAFRRSRMDDELREEIEEHIELRTAQLVAGGMDPREAAFEARRGFGNVTAIREETREMWGFRWIDTLVQDLRYGARLLRRSPLFTLVAVLSLAIGIGATAAVFSLTDAVLLRKLPVRAPDELVVIRWVSGPTYVFESLNGYAGQTETENTSTSFSRAAYEAIRAKAGSLVDVFGFADLYQVNLSVDGRPDTALGQAVTGNYYSVLAISPAAGRTLLLSDDVPGAPPVAVLGHAFARRRFGDAAGAVGRPLVLNGVSFTVVGVAPPGFRGTLQVGQQHDVTIPTSMYAAVTRADDPADPNYWWLLMMGRLKPGVTAADAQPTLDLLVKQTVAAAKPDLAAKDLPRVVLDPGARGQLEDRANMREPLQTMAMVVAIVLLVACANVANLLLARGKARGREVAVRVAIGAPRSRIVRQLLTESLLLALLGGALGILVAQWLGNALLPALADTTDPLVVGAGIDWRVLLFAALLATTSSVLIGLVPSMRTTDVRLASGLQEGTRGAGGGRRRDALSSSLVVLQVGLSTMLLTAAGLLVHSVRNLERVDPGFDPQNTLVFTVDPQLNGYEREQTRNFHSRALDRLAGLPGVRSASLSSHALIANSSSIGVSRPAGTPAPPPGSADARAFERKNLVWRQTVDGRFFETLGIPLLQGRTFARSDTSTAQPVAIVNRSLARQLFGTTDAIGRRFVFGLGDKNPEIEVIGIVADAKYTSMRREAPPTAYLHYLQQPIGRATYEIRTATNPAWHAPAVREAMRELDATLPLTNLRTLDDQIGQSLRREHLFARLATLLGGVTLVLSAIGLYGLLAYSVTRRTPEIGIRMALGAARGAVRWMVVRRSLVLVTMGLALGIAGAIAGTRVIESLLFGLTPTDPAAIAAAVAIMLGVSLAAAYVPARRASRVDPIVALRTE